MSESAGLTKFVLPACELILRSEIRGPIRPVLEGQQFALGFLQKTIIYLH